MESYLGEVGSIKQDANYDNLMFEFDIDAPQHHVETEESRLMSDDLFIAESIEEALEEQSPIVQPILPASSSPTTMEAFLEKATSAPHLCAQKRTASDSGFTETGRRPRVSEIYDQLDEILSPLSSVTSCENASPAVDDRFKLERCCNGAHESQRNVRAKLELVHREEKVASPFSEDQQSDVPFGDAIPSSSLMKPTLNGQNVPGDSFPHFDQVDINHPADQGRLEPLPKSLGTPDPSFECNVCRKTFTRHCNMIKHKRRAHGIMKDFPCKACWVSFPVKEDLEKHMQEYHKSKGSFSCTSCGATFSQKFNLNKHIRNVHEKKRPFECSSCLQSFQQRDHLNKHVATVHEKQKPFKCPICEMSFGWLGVLNKHVSLIHHKERPFTCEECHSSFQQKAHLQKHCRTVHNKARPISCSLCSCSFSKKEQLERHCSAAHPEKSDQDETETKVFPPAPPASGRDTPVRSTLTANSLINLANSTGPVGLVPGAGLAESEEFSVNPFGEGAISLVDEHIGEMG